MKKIFALFLVSTFLSAAVLSTFTYAAEEKGKLDSVEQEIETPSTTGSQTSSIDATGIATQGILDLLMSFFMMGIVSTGSENFPELYKELKSEWQPALPTVRLEPSYQYVFNGIHGFSGKLEAGYLIVGVDGEYTRYFEKSPNDNLDIWSTHFLLRTIFTKHFGTNLALGAKIVRGGQNRTAFEIGVPFYIYPSRYFIFDIQPFLATFGGKNIYDLGAGAAFKYKLIGVRAGYRALFVGDQKLHGPRIGLFLQY